MDAAPYERILDFHFELVRTLLKAGYLAVLPASHLGAFSFIVVCLSRVDSEPVRTLA